MTIKYNKKLLQKARSLRKNMTLSEVLLWNQLKNKNLKGYDFHRQVPIGNYIVDFYCPKYKLVIEIDGASHDKKNEYDLKRDEYLNSLGIRVLHFMDISVKRSMNEVVDTIINFIDSAP